MVNETLIFAHRGSSGTHPENTMEAFKAALEAGAEGIELDVQLTKDLIPVVIHDETLERTTNGSGWVRDHTLAQLQQLDAGSWFSPNFTGVKIPTLNDVLEWLVKTPLHLNIELKNGVVRYPGIEKIIVDLLNGFDLLDRIIISSFNHYSLVEVHNLNPSIETAILFMEALYEPWNYANSVGAQGLHCYLPVAVPEYVAAASKAGMPLRIFTVNENEQIMSLLQSNCAAIFTDWPEKAVNFRIKLNDPIKQK